MKNIEDYIFAYQNTRNPIIKWFIYVIYRIRFPASNVSIHCKIGDSTRFMHCGIGIVINEKAEIGSGCTIFQNVTIGQKGIRANKKVPKVGNNVYIGAGACILGDVVIGNNCIIAANSVVIRDVPDYSVVAGVPAKIIAKTDDKIREVYDF